ncbi:MAG: MBOAT family protein [Clostridia bacterium]|nr:MBOAT family protein [Clostridia bacterium]
MSILSLEFLVLLAVLLVVHYCLPVRWRWCSLLAASMAFYAFAGWVGLAYLGGVTLVTWLAGLYMGRCRRREKEASAEGDKAEAWRRAQKRKCYLTLTVLLVIGGMAFIKYADLIYTCANALYVFLTQSRTPLTAMQLITPLGLSYFTFQSVGYVVDCARGKAEPEKNPLKYLLFVSFFPQITQGPITTYKQLMPQLKSPARFEPQEFVAGFQLMLWGYFKKMVLADRLACITTAVTSGTEMPGWLILLGAVTYAIRLYADFSGGMDVIRGASKMLGVDVVENFRRPFFSQSVAEYWRRWHITLGTWFRSYLFYPLTTSHFGLMLSRWGQRVLGKKAGRALPGVVATFVIFFLIGVWHVANWNAVIYGAYFGILLSGALLIDPLLKTLRKKHHEFDQKLGAKVRDLFRRKPEAVLAGENDAEQAGSTEVPQEQPVKETPRWVRGLCAVGKGVGKGITTALRLLRTWVLILLPQYFAFTSGPAQGWALLKGTFTNWDFSNVKNTLIVTIGMKTSGDGAWQKALTEYRILFIGLVILLAVDLLCEFKVDVNRKLARSFFLIRWVVLFALILSVLLFGAYGADFDAAAFLYTNF